MTGMRPFLLLLTAIAMAAAPGFAAANGRTPALCPGLAAHIPDADVAYRPDVDIHGNAVPSADLPGAAVISAPDGFEITVTLSLAQRLGLVGGGPAMIGGDIEFGRFTVTTGGQVFFDGQEITSRQTEELRDYCAANG